MPVGRIQRHVARRRARKDRVGAIVFIKRLEDDHFIAGIDDRHHRRHHRFGRAASDADFALRVDFHAEIPRRFFDDGVAEILRAPGDRILIHVGHDGVAGGELDLFRRGEIGKALRQVDRAIEMRLPRHLADDRFGELLGFVRNDLLGHY